MTDISPASHRSWLKLAFGASLAANLFLIGLVGGQAFSKSDENENTPWPRGFSLHPRVMMEALPEDRHDEIRAFYDEARKGIGRSWRGIGVLRREIGDALRAVPFDEAALRDAQRREVEARTTMRMEQNDDITTFLATLSDEDRKLIADVAIARLEAQSAYWRERRRKREAEEKKSAQP